jgi:hypothetical protein
VQAILGERFIGAYLSGSLANGDFDEHSDVDVVIVAEQEITDPYFSALSTMHQRLAALDSWCATQLEVTYISRAALRRFDPAQARHANLDRGEGERLKMIGYDEGWLVQCHLLHERGITLAGPAPRSLIDPVSPEDLKQAMRAILAGWAAEFLHDPAPLSNQGYQSYTVLSLCRILYTLEHGAVVSKPAAARWAQTALEARWVPLIERAGRGRQHPQAEAPAQAVGETQAFIRHALERHSLREALEAIA